MTCPECYTDTEGGGFGDDAWCPKCETKYGTEWDYIDAMEGSMASWTVGEPVPMTAQEWADFCEVEE